MLNTVVHEKWFPNNGGHTTVADSEVEVEEQKQVIKSRLRLVLFRLVCRVWRERKSQGKMAAWNPVGGGGRANLGFARPFLFRVTHDGSSERGTTRSIGGFRWVVDGAADSPFFLVFLEYFTICFENRFIKCSLILSFRTLTLLYFASRIRPQCCMLDVLKSGGGGGGGWWGTRPPLSKFSGSAPAWST